jgi:hypothetical protein
MASPFDKSQLQAALDKAIRATADDNEGRLKVVACLEKAKKKAQQPSEVLFQYIPGVRHYCIGETCSAT